MRVLLGLIQKHGQGRGGRGGGNRFTMRKKVEINWGSHNMTDKMVMVD